jgi:ABC transport system ATP-binding/permease protein
MTSPEIEKKLARLKADLGQTEAREHPQSPKEAKPEPKPAHKPVQKPGQMIKTKNFPGLIIELKGISKSFSGKKIIRNISATFTPGNLTAILGPSGCGKSTLLKCISTIYKPNSGNILLNGESLKNNKLSYRSQIGFVPQDDIIAPELKVKDAFYYSAKLRLDQDIPEQQVNKRINSILQLLGLNEQKKQRINSLSGGQRKRVNIGIECIADPMILILDEPASGLDPGTEEDLINLLKKLSSQNRTILMTTHSMEYLSLFNSIIVLKEGKKYFEGNHSQLLENFGISHAADLFKKMRKK